MCVCVSKGNMRVGGGQSQRSQAWSHYHLGLFTPVTCISVCVNTRLCEYLPPLLPTQ